jgi:AbiV family abortive infection protein
VECLTCAAAYGGWLYYLVGPVKLLSIGDPMDSANQTPIIANAARLLKDAKLLVNHERYASAFALAVLALEEIGKVVLHLWGNPEATSKLNKHPSAPIKKQAAVSSLLLAESVAKELGAAITTGSASDELVERVARFMHGSESGRFHWLVRIGAMDKTKQVALYRDDWLDAAGLSADQFTYTDLQALFEQCRHAIAAVGDQRMMRVGKAIYEADLLQNR